jgi:hypothetical protein
LLTICRGRKATQVPHHFGVVERLLPWCPPSSTMAISLLKTSYSGSCFSHWFPPIIFPLAFVQQQTTTLHHKKGYFKTLQNLNLWELTYKWSNDNSERWRKLLTTLLSLCWQCTWENEWMNDGHTESPQWWWLSKAYNVQLPKNLMYLGLHPPKHEKLYPYENLHSVNTCHLHIGQRASQNFILSPEPAHMHSLFPMGKANKHTTLLHR